MKKTLSLVIFTLLNLTAYSQVGVGTTQVEKDLLLKVKATDKGFLLPNITIPDLSKAAPVNNPAYGLLVYNNHPEKKGFNYWDGSKWSTLIDTNNIYSVLGLTISYSTSNSNPVSLTAPQGALNYAENSLPETIWTEVPGLTKEINITNTNNNVFIITEGMVQANNDTPNLSNVFTYAVGIFVDGKLAGVRNYSSKYANSYQYDFFSINTLLQNLSAGKHTIQTFVTLRYNVYTNATNWKFGGSNNTSSVNDDMSKINMFIKVTEKI
jgi:hypothetical protein